MIIYKKYKFLILLILLAVLTKLFLSNFFIINFANYLDYNGYFSQEEYILNKNLEIQKWCLRKNSLHEFSGGYRYALLKLVNFYKSQNDYVSIEKLYVKNIDENGITLLVNGLYSTSWLIDAANVYSDLGLVYLKMGNYENAKKYFFKALKLRNNVLESNLRSNLLIDKERLGFDREYNNIGEYYLIKNNFKEAKNNFDKAYEIVVNSKEYKEKKETLLFQTYVNYSNYYLITKNYNLAEFYAEKLFFSIPVNVLPLKSYTNFQSYYIAKINEIIGDIKYSQKDYTSALFFCRKQEALNKELYGVKSTNYSCSQYKLSQVYKKLGRNDLSENLDAEILDSNEKFILFKSKEKSERYSLMESFCK